MTAPAEKTIERLPPWQDLQELARNISGKSERTILNWVRAGDLPPPRRRCGGTDLWKWSEVDDWLTFGPPHKRSVSPDAQAEAITENVRNALANRKNH